MEGAWNTGLRLRPAAYAQAERSRLFENSRDGHLDFVFVVIHSGTIARVLGDLQNQVRPADAQLARQLALVVAGPGQALADHLALERLDRVVELPGERHRR